MSLIQKLQEELNSIKESRSFFIDPKDAPEWVQKTLKGEGIRKSIGVEVGDSPYVDGSYGDGDRVTLFMYRNGVVKRVDGEWGGPTINGTALGNAVANGTNQRLQPGDMLLRTSSRIGSATLFVHPDDVAAMLPLPNSDDLTVPEKIVLVATRSLKSSYGGIPNFRFSEASSQTGITQADWDLAKESLTKKGFLNKAGAITTSGKNALIPVEKQYGFQSLYALGKEYRDNE